MMAAMMCEHGELDLAKNISNYFLYKELDSKTLVEMLVTLAGCDYYLDWYYNSGTYKADAATHRENMRSLEDHKDKIKAIQKILLERLEK